MVRDGDAFEREAAGLELVRHVGPADDRRGRGDGRVVGDGDPRRRRLAAAPPGRDRQGQAGVAGIDVLRQGDPHGDRAVAIVDLVGLLRLARPRRRAGDDGLAERPGRGQAAADDGAGDRGAARLDIAVARHRQGHRHAGIGRIGVGAQVDQPLRAVVVRRRRAESADEAARQRAREGDAEHPAVRLDRCGGDRHGQLLCKKKRRAEGFRAAQPVRSGLGLRRRRT